MSDEPLTSKYETKVIYPDISSKHSELFACLYGFRKLWLYLLFS